ncbi:restriction endonuclease subunit S [Lactococcus lactis]|uniref:restriction endonuclease subunit S n=1 Tax=Lactococcus lactis TaxID=1358 RepID=UPI0021A8523C|nr:restriction endonuclease subunit S [Lactococcus lactis]MCT3126334.1 restriction endonuclease subunit S [Lactococcus lactis]
MKERLKAPELRFPGFTDDWEERKLKELGDIQTGNTPPTSDSDNYSLDGVLWVTPTDIKSLVISNTAKKLSQVGVTKARIAKAGSILVTSIASIGKNTLLRMDAGFNQQINSLTPTSENDSYFLLTQSEKWSEKMKQTAASATMQIVNKTDFSNISTYVPVHKEEQEKIGSFFKQLDDTIALHQRKLDLLKEQKKGYLQKMFPKNGSKIPELRFEGFTDDWELRKFGEMLVNLEAGVSVNSSDYDTGYFILKTSAIKMGNIDLLEVKSIVSEEVARAKTPLIKNSIIISRMNTPELVGASGLVRESIDNIFLPDRLWQGQVAGNFSPEWLIQSINIAANIKKIRDLATGTSGSMKNISKKSMLDLIINIPTLEEQQKIGSFFKQLDDVIALHQLKLDLLKEQKKGFLQKMFA